MNNEERELAGIILARSKNEIKRVQHYLQLMRAVKLRVDIEAILAKQGEKEGKSK